MLKVCIQGFVGGQSSPGFPGSSAISHQDPGNRLERRLFILGTVMFLLMRDKGSSRGKSKSVESAEPKPAAGAEGKDTRSKPAPMTAKEKIAANQKNKRRK
jgi:hypothetical protein